MSDEPTYIDDAVTHSLEGMAEQSLERFAYNFARANFDRAARWAKLFDGISGLGSDLAFEDDRADA